MKKQFGNEYGKQPSNSRRREGFANVEVDPMAQNQVAYGDGVILPKQALENEFRTRGANLVPSDQYYDAMNRVPPGKDVQITPVTDQLLQASPNYILTDKYFDQPDAKLFLQDLQPKLYSYTVDPQPINSNIGVGQSNCPQAELVTYNMECNQTRVSRLNLLPYKIL
jgi:hypothetical protein